MTARRMLGLCSAVAFLYAAAIFWLDYEQSRQFPHEKRIVIGAPGPVTIGTTPVEVIEAPFLSTDDFVQSTITLSIGSEYFTSSDEVWIDTRADPDVYPARYPGRFDMGYLVHSGQERLYIVETLQGDFALADEPRLNLWSVNEQGHIESAAAVTVAQAKLEPAWRPVFAGLHAPRPRTIPAIAGALLGCGLLLLAVGRFWRDGSWGVVCALGHFLVPVIGGAPLLANPDRGYLLPAILGAFLLTAWAGAAVSIGWKSRATARLSAGVTRIAGVAVVTLLVGVVTTLILTTLAALLVGQWSWPPAAEMMATSVMRPAMLLLRVGAGVALVMAIAGSLYFVLLERKLRQVRAESTWPSEGV